METTVLLFEGLEVQKRIATAKPSWKEQCGKLDLWLKLHREKKTVSNYLKAVMLKISIKPPKSQQRTAGKGNLNFLTNTLLFNKHIIIMMTIL